jgi:hypothetical protein
MKSFEKKFAILVFHDDGYVDIMYEEDLSRALETAESIEVSNGRRTLVVPAYLPRKEGS